MKSKRIPNRVLKRIEKKVDMVKLVGKYTTLRKKGLHYWGLCPFHEEKTPSFTVNPDKGVFYCFGCHKGGSIFTFIMEVEKLGFKEAVEYLRKYSS